MESIAVFCGAQGGAAPAFREAAQALGTLLARRRLRLVYGGGHVGMMGTLADAALAAGGEVIGVIPRDLQEKECAHPGVSRMHVVDGMHERKALIGAFSDAFVALPGGFGTLEELFEVVTWSQLSFHEKPSCLLNVEGFFDHLLAHVDAAYARGFLTERDRRLLRVASSPAEVLDLLAAAP